MKNVPYKKNDTLKPVPKSMKEIVPNLYRS